jgi:tritrans,polycis-undecaprenyl-diphosphate synthase [geranylgeranyl-diphosphate specific]
MEPWKGHKLGVKKFKDILEWCQELGIKIVTIYCFSLENFSRPKEEFDFLMNLFEREFKRMIHDSRIHQNKVRINVIGRIHMLPKGVQEVIKELTKITKNYSNYILNLALAYGGRTEIVDATKKIAQLVKQGKLKIEDIDENLFSKELYVEMPDVDLIIRTSEQRLSGFLPWQSTYSELIFLPDKFFPEFTKEDFLSCIKEFSNRKRRFGK